MDAALAVRAASHENRDRKTTGVFSIVFKYIALGHQFGLAVEIGWTGHIGGAVGRCAVAVEDHVGGDVQEAGTEVGGDL